MEIAASYCHYKNPMLWVVSPRWCHEACHGSNIASASTANTRWGRVNPWKAFAGLLSPMGGDVSLIINQTFLLKRINYSIITIAINNHQKSPAEPLKKSWLAWQSSPWISHFFDRETVRMDVALIPVEKWFAGPTGRWIRELDCTDWWIHIGLYPLPGCQWQNEGL